MREPVFAPRRSVAESSKTVTFPVVLNCSEPKLVVPADATMILPPLLTLKMALPAIVRISLLVAARLTLAALKVAAFVTVSWLPVTEVSALVDVRVADCAAL